jgi:LysM domain-containing protein
MTDRLRRLVAICPLVVLLAAACLPDTLGSSSSPAAPATATTRPTPSGPTPVPTFVAPTPTPGPTFFTYVVVRGDTLIKIAKRFKTTDRSIAFWNRGTYPSLDPQSEKYRPNRIEIGWTFVLIPGQIVDEQNLPDETPVPDTTPDAEASPSATPA